MHARRPRRIFQQVVFGDGLPGVDPSGQSPIDIGLLIRGELQIDGLVEPAPKRSGQEQVGLANSALDAQAHMIGPDILCWNSIFWIKEAGSPSYVGWHQDLEYWGLDNDELVSAWIALSPASEAAGAMSVLPGSHRELLAHNETYHAHNMLTRGQELKIDVSEREVASMALEPGQMSMHNVRLAHGSGPNTTDDRRIGLSLQYMPTRTKQRLVDWDFATLVRGTDTYGHFELTPRPQRDFDPVAVEFHQRAGVALRELLYQGAERPAERAPTL